jgi:hypothetical protein
MTESFEGVGIVELLDKKSDFLQFEERVLDGGNEIA